MPYYRKQQQGVLAGLLDRLQNAVFTPLADLAVTAYVTAEGKSLMPAIYADKVDKQGMADLIAYLLSIK